MPVYDSLGHITLMFAKTDPNGNWAKAELETDDDFKQLKASFPKPRDAVDYIIDTFPIVKRKDEAVKTGKAYRKRLSPGPGSRECCHPAKADRKH